MKCHSCGEEIRDTARFCGFCGAEQMVTPAEEVPSMEPAGIPELEPAPDVIAPEVVAVNEEPITDIPDLEVEIPEQPEPEAMPEPAEEPVCMPALEEISEPVTQNVEEPAPVEVPAPAPVAEPVPTPAPAAPAPQPVPVAAPAPQPAPQPVYQAPPQPQYQQPVYQTPAQPQYQQPVYQVPPQPQYQVPQPVYQPQYQQPVYQAPPQPQYQQPVYQTPAQPQYQQPRPVYQAPAQPVYQPKSVAHPVQQRPAYQLTTVRGLVKLWLLTFITLGIYPLVMWSRMSVEINMVASRYDGKRTTHFIWLPVLSALTLGIYMFVWLHKLCNRIGDEVRRRNIQYKFGAASFWLWNFVYGMVGVAVTGIVGYLLYTTMAGETMIVAAVVAVLGIASCVGPAVFGHKILKAFNLMNADYNEKG